ncbi:hypothetical protein FXF51_16315 [Nonomuraea sp. PA05]|uniref:hypothetical protein n=1 Tax=Nonomuraea sp. PA05 TaxID=2604466 RepID=UPI0011DA8632|nr:hypothetical protein [Nonomuraea sp. PA05]TYB66666.1 hypothetical protein FXF51_16315 [Nonomuraea sp. PA05]
MRHPTGWPLPGNATRALQRVLMLCVLVISAVAVNASRADAAVTVHEAWHGSAVRLHMWLNYDPANGERLRAWATVTDTAGGADYSVSIVSVDGQLDADGWGGFWPETDTGNGPFRYCPEVGGIWITYRVEYAWINSAGQITRNSFTEPAGGGLRVCD